MSYFPAQQDAHNEQTQSNQWNHIMIPRHLKDFLSALNHKGDNYRTWQPTL